MTAVLPGSLRLYLIESQRLFGGALRDIFSLDSEIDVVGESNAVRASEIRDADPDFIILDLEADPRALRQSVATCRDAAPRARMCALAVRPHPSIMQECLDAGAAGYVVTDVSPRELIRAVKAIAGGETYVDARAGGSLLRRGVEQDRPGRNDLSQRETDVIRLIAEGLTNKEIAFRLSLTETSVKNHISRIFAKIDVCARSQAAAYAIRTGIC